MAIINITRNFTKNAETGRYTAQVAGFNGYLQIERESVGMDTGFYIMAQLEGMTPTGVHYSAKRNDLVRLDYPESMMLIVESSTPVKNCMIAMVSGSGSGEASSEAVAKLQQQMAEQIALNEMQQEQIERNTESNAKVQQAIPIEDENGNGIPDGVERINNIEEKVDGLQPMGEEGLNEVLGLIK